jgi:hypothetical protein
LGKEAGGGGGPWFPGPLFFILLKATGFQLVPTNYREMLGVRAPDVSFPEIVYIHEVWIIQMFEDLAFFVP